MKVTIQVVAGSNESIQVESDLKDPSQWDERVKPVLAKIEQRVGDRARRLMAGSTQLRELAKAHPEQASLVQNLVLICLGQMPTVTTEGLVEQAFETPMLQKTEESEPYVGRRA